MGCDIHLHQEIKVKGKWLHYSHINPRRNYTVFGKLANVRNIGVVPIAEPRGMPPDATESTWFSCNDDWGSDGHSHSYINAEEIAEFYEWYEKNIGVDRPFFFEDNFGYLCGNGWGSFLKYRTDYPASIEDIRWIFWFDN